MMGKTDTPMAEVYVIEVGEQTGENWGRSSTDHLHEVLLGMESALRIAQSDTYTFADLDRWEIDRDEAADWTDSRDDVRRDALEERVGCWPLSIEADARLNFETGEYDLPHKVELLLACGGPTISLILDLRRETVRLERSWSSERSSAESPAAAAVDLTANFVEAFFGLELDR